MPRGRLTILNDNTFYIEPIDEVGEMIARLKRMRNKYAEESDSSGTEVSQLCDMIVQDLENIIDDYNKRQKD